MDNRIVESIRENLRTQGFTFSPEERGENGKLRQANLVWVGTNISRSVSFWKLEWWVKWYVLKQMWKYIFR